MPGKQKKSFEEALKRLEEIVKLLESDISTLDESIQLYEEGISLITFCEKELKKAEGKITRVIKGTDGNLTEEPFNLKLDLE